MYPTPVATAKLFKKCWIYSQNPVYTNIFLCRKKNGFYCINIKNMSIRKINNTNFSCSNKEYANTMFSSNGLYFVIIITHPNYTTINAFNTNTLELIKSFNLTLILKNQYYGISFINIHNIDFSEITDCVLYNEYLICKVKYMSEPYLRHDYEPRIESSGTEVYNIITGKLVANNFNLELDKLYITNKNIVCSTYDNPTHLCKLTPQLNITKLSNYEFKQNMRTYIFEQNIISFDFVKCDGVYKLYSLVINSDEVCKTLVNCEFNSNYEPVIYNIKYVEKHNLFIVIVYLHNSFKVLLFDKAVKRCLFDFKVNLENKFYILDDWRIIFDFHNTVYTLDTPLNKLAFVKSLIKQIIIANN